MFPNDNDFESEFTFENTATPLPEEPPFLALLLGDWSANSNRKALNERRPIVVDRDNFEDVLKKLNVKLDLNLEGNVLNLEFAELDDFHPDNLFRQLPVFSELRDVRRRLANPDTFAGAADEVRSWFQTPADEKSSNDIQSEINDAPPIESNDLLDMILSQPGESSGSAKVQTADNSELGRLVSKLVSPYLIKIDENEQSKLITAVDETISELMRNILHHPKFQALESAWRGLYFLVRRVETDATLKILILDLSKNEFIDNLKAVNSLTDSFPYQRIVAETVEMADRDSFAVVGGNYSFGLNVDDVASLIRMSKIAAAAGAPFISHLKPEIFGIEDFSESIEASRFKGSDNSNEGKLWTALRTASEANYVGLSPMRILARMPYGSAGDSAEAFSFEEFTGINEHKDYLWMNPCFVLILLLAQSYRLFGWQFGQQLKLDIENLPMPHFQENGEIKTKPSAEVVLTESSLTAILGQGLMPLVSFRDSDKVRLGRFQSISLSMPQLNGRWGS